MEKKEFRCTKKQNLVKEENLKKIVRIYESNISDYDKLYQISEMYNTYEFFRKSYSILMKERKIDDYYGQCLKKLVEILNWYKNYEDNGDLAKINHIRLNTHYIINYKTAKLLINEYINDSNSYKTAYFLEIYGLTKEDLDLCVEIIKNYNPDLYEKYLEKFEKNKTKRYMSNYNAFLDIINAIKTGTFSNGVELSKLEFLKRIPFKWDSYSRDEFHEMSNKENKLKYSFSFIKRIKEFLFKNFPEDYRIFVNYMYENKINDSSNSIIDINGIYNTDTYINGKLITKEDNDKIFSYIKENKLPKIISVYNIVREQYLNGDIIINDIYKEKEKNETKKLYLLK